MATIEVRASAGKRRITIRGRLVAADLRRLERACGPTLEHREIPLEIRLRGTVMDDASRLFVSRLVRRGAVLT